MRQLAALATPIDRLNAGDQILGFEIPCTIEIRPTMALTVVALIEPKRLAFTCPQGAVNMAFLFTFTWRGQPYSFEMPVGKVAPGGAGFVESMENE